MNKSKKDNSYSIVFLILSITFVVCLLLSNILAAKLIKIGSFSVTSGVLVFPISYIVGDLLTEVYGYNNAKKVIKIGFIMNLFMVLIFTLAIILPSPEWYTNDKAFKLILGSTPRIVFAGFLAYLFGSLANSKVLAKMKEKNPSRFSLRAVISTIAGESVDSLIFVFISFVGKLTITNIIEMIILQITLKTLYEIICLPITNIVLNKVKKYERIN